MAKLASQHRVNPDLNISIQNVLDRCAKTILNLNLMAHYSPETESQRDRRENDGLIFNLQVFKWLYLLSFFGIFTIPIISIIRNEDINLSLFTSLLIWSINIVMLYFLMELSMTLMNKNQNLAERIQRLENSNSSVIDPEN
jgi:ABC-type multidrug transport system fused ATPase/permease subunit